MAYVAVKGGTKAVLNAEQLVDYFRLKGGSEPISVRQIQDQMRLAVDRAMGEGAIYAPELAALALKQSEGDALEASFLLRAYRSTISRVDYSLPAKGARMRVLRRISATFKDIPGGQLLGPTRDYNLRLLNTLLREESSQSARERLTEIEELMMEEVPEGQQAFPKVIESMRAQHILAEPPVQEQAEANAEPYDITRKALTFPAPRSARLQVLSQADAGSLMTFAYSSVRGYSDVHPTLGELRYGYIPVEVAHPLTGEPVEIGEILATECEMVSRVESAEDGQDAESKQEAALPKFGLGYGFGFGHSEVKVMSMSLLDRVLSAAKENNQHGGTGPASNEEFVLLHTDGIEASGFTAHYKLPHYVTFQANISVLERSRNHRAAQFAETAERRQQAEIKLQDLLNKARQSAADK
ncbi:carbon-phosphorus lyase complex subunit PhnI [Dictyobacter formicarum]|uniref:Carbon-phosphorus lyase n=1 Tax=Dictyobacter formicarum TaxID=2778368 RepID=A0ABQ3VDW1_9CHLR|nr:carbon-phosphorus lyase complex subunit PhnI [Dictyobacter formicarum]GHO83901.1 carbon-phosphorus lyase [Dictyobacter formicarum]